MLYIASTLCLGAYPRTRQSYVLVVLACRSKPLTVSEPVDTASCGVFSFRFFGLVRRVGEIFGFLGGVLCGFKRVTSALLVGCWIRIEHELNMIALRFLVGGVSSL